MAFATADDVATRLGRDLTDNEVALVESVIAGVTGLIADAAGMDAAWAEALDPVPATLRELCIAKAISAGANPANVASFSETLGAHSYSATFPRSSDGGVFLTESEERLVRRLVGNAVSGSVRVPSLVHDIYGDETQT